MRSTDGGDTWELIEMTESIRLPNGKEQRPGFVVPGVDGQVARSGNVLYCAAPPMPAADLRHYFL